MKLPVLAITSTTCMYYFICTHNQRFLVFVVESLNTNILPTNEAFILITFTCSPSSNHKNNKFILLNHE